MDTLRVLSYIGYIFLCINVIIYTIGFSKNRGAYRIFSVYLVIIAIIQAIMEFYAHYGYNNHFLSNYYLVFRFILISGFFYLLFLRLNKKISKGIAVISCITTVGLIFQYCLNFDTYYTFNSIGFLVTTIILVLFSVLYLYEMLSLKLPFYYTTIGILLYLMSSVVIFVSATSLLSFRDETDMLLWKINALLFIVYQLLILWEWKITFYNKVILTKT